jgi:hypothetical protein
MAVNMPFHLRSGVLELAVAAITFAVILSAIFLYTPRTTLYEGRDYDGRFYAAMAGDRAMPEDFARRPPWCYRVLTPWIISKLPGELFARAKVWNLVCNWTTAMLLFMLTRRLGGGAASSILAGGLVLLSFWGARFSFFSVFYIEPLTLLFMVLGLLLVADRRYAALVVLAPLFVLQKPQCMVLPICALVRDIQERRLSRRAVGAYLAMALLAAGTYFALLRAIGPVVPGGAGSLQVVAIIVVKLMSEPDYLLRSILSTGIGLGVLPWLVFFLPSARARLARQGWLVAYVVLGLFTLLGGMDKGRLAFVIAPALAAVGAVGISELRLARGRWALLAGVLVASHLLTQAPWEDLTNSDAYLANLEPVHAKQINIPSLAARIGLAALVAYALLRLMDRSPRAGIAPLSPS